MKPREDHLLAALREAGHVAASIQYGIHFQEVALGPRKNYIPLVTAALQVLPSDHYSIDLTADQERHTTQVIIMSFTGLAAEALYRGHHSVDILAQEELHEVLDLIEHRFRNDAVRKAFTEYCLAEAFALLDDNRRLWRYVMALARELANKKKLTYGQCMGIYEREYLVG